MNLGTPHTLATTMNDPQSEDSALPADPNVFLQHRNDDARRKGMQIQLAVDGERVRLVRVHSPR